MIIEELEIEITCNERKDVLRKLYQEERERERERDRDRDRERDRETDRQTDRERQIERVWNRHNSEKERVAKNSKK